MRILPDKIIIGIGNLFCLLSKLRILVNISLPSIIGIRKSEIIASNCSELA